MALISGLPFINEIRFFDFVFALTGLVVGLPVLVVLTVIGLFDTGSQPKAVYAGQVSHHEGGYGVGGVALGEFEFDYPIWRVFAPH